MKTIISTSAPAAYEDPRITLVKAINNSGRVTHIVKRVYDKPTMLVEFGQQKHTGLNTMAEWEKIVEGTGWKVLHSDKTAIFLEWESETSANVFSARYYKLDSILTVESSK